MSKIQLFFSLSYSYQLSIISTLFRGTGAPAKAAPAAAAPGPVLDGVVAMVSPPYYMT